MIDTATPDLVTLISSLSADALVRRLDEIDREASALRVLLRAVRAREQANRRQQRAPQQQREEVPHGR